MLRRVWFWHTWTFPAAFCNSDGCLKVGWQISTWGELYESAWRGSSSELEEALFPSRAYTLRLHSCVCVCVFDDMPIRRVQLREISADWVTSVKRLKRVPRDKQALGFPASCFQTKSRSVRLWDTRVPACMFSTLRHTHTHLQLVNKAEH